MKLYAGICPSDEHVKAVFHRVLEEFDLARYMLKEVISPIVVVLVLDFLGRGKRTDSQQRSKIENEDEGRGRLGRQAIPRQLYTEHWRSRASLRGKAFRRH